jgi:hypothetical protein
MLDGAQKHKNIRRDVQFCDKMDEQGGKTCYLLFSGEDWFSLRKAVLIY